MHGKILHFEHISEDFILMQNQNRADMSQMSFLLACHCCAASRTVNIKIFDSIDTLCFRSVAVSDKGKDERVRCLKVGAFTGPFSRMQIFQQHFRSTCWGGSFKALC
jgi:hypothetical protein